MGDYTRLNKLAEEEFDRMSAALDFIWAHPETGYKEWKTQEYLASEFEKLGYTLVKAGNIPGFYADLNTGKPGPTVVLMGEMDSLINNLHPQCDPQTGAVHSCGHCAQVSSLLGVAAALKHPGALDGLCGRIRLMAVPAAGIVLSAQGASVIQSWMDEESLRDPEFDIPDAQKHPDHFHEVFGAWNHPSQLYHEMLEPLLPYSFGSVIWYQGESNGSDAEGRVYLKMLTRMIQCWRSADRDPRLPFLIVQLADTEERLNEGWRDIQAAQLAIADRLPNVRSVICADVSERTMIHPVTKWKLADRIAALLP